MKGILILLLITIYLISCGSSIPPRSISSAKVQSFNNVKIVVKEEEKTHERGAILHFTDSNILIREKNTANRNALAIPYNYVIKAEYEQTKHFRGALGSMFGAFIKLFSKNKRYYSKKHWLTICYFAADGKECCLKLRLHKKNYRKILSSLQIRTGIIVKYHELS
jgi:hypothetical protein